MNLDALKERMIYMRSCPGFYDFATAIGYRIEDEKAHEALAMIIACGAEEKLARDIVSGWPLNELDQQLAPVIDVKMEAAIRFSFFVDDLSRTNWNVALNRAVHAAEALPSAADAKEKADGTL